MCNVDFIYDIGTRTFCWSQPLAFSDLMSTVLGIPRDLKLRWQQIVSNSPPGWTPCPQLENITTLLISNQTLVFVSWHLMIRKGRDQILRDHRVSIRRSLSTSTLKDPLHVSSIFGTWVLIISTDLLWTRLMDVWCYKCCYFFFYFVYGVMVNLDSIFRVTTWVMDPPGSVWWRVRT